jgi:predicted dehydrogenase
VPGRVPVAVAGAGLIGRRHIESLQACPETSLAAVVDPAPAAARLAADAGVPAHPSLEDLFAAGGAAGVILATPNRLHVEGGLACVAAGLPVLVEKPVADTVAGAVRLVSAAEAAGVPLLVGHHRQHSPIMTAAREVVRSGALGQIVAVTGSAIFYKPDEYFEVGGGWRRRPGAGPILLNLIHDVNTLMSLVGDVVSVQAMTSNAARGFDVEDTAAMVFRFAGGALGTFLLSDTAAAARSWEHTSGENPDYPAHPDEDAYLIAGVNGSLGIPTMRLRVYPGRRSWYEPFDTSVVPVDRSDPLVNQAAHFAAVIRGTAAPVVSGRDGMNALRVTEAVTEAAASGRTVETGLGAL